MKDVEEGILAEGSMTFQNPFPGFVSSVYEGHTKRREIWPPLSGFAGVPKEVPLKHPQSST